jgi:hypothetical protein
MHAHYRPNDLVVYFKRKHSAHPGRRARDVRPCAHGDSYDYVVAKYWVVVACSERALVVRTPGGKLHQIDPRDPALERAGPWQRLRLRLFDRARLRGLESAS